MDLNFLKEPVPLKPDFGWWLDGDSFDVKKNERNPHECKDELALQWGEGYIVETVDNNIPSLSGKLSRHAAIKDSLVLFARSLMNSGIKTNEIREYLAKQQKPEHVASCKGEIERQLKLEGSVGRFVLDARGFNSCKEAYKQASKNPFLKHIRYVIGCKCDHKKEQKTIIANDSESSGDPFGDSLRDQKTAYKTTKICPETGLVVMAGQGDIDEEWAGQTMIDVMNACDLKKEDGKKFTASKDQPYIVLKRFFIALDLNQIKKNEEEYDMETPVDNLEINPVYFKVEKDVPVSEIEMKNEGYNIVISDLKREDLDVNINQGKAFSILDDVKEEKLDIDSESNPLTIEEFEKEQEFVPVNIDSETIGDFELKQKISNPELQLIISDPSIDVGIKDSEEENEDFEFGDSDPFFQNESEIMFNGSKEREEPLKISF